MQLTGWGPWTWKWVRISGEYRITHIILPGTRVGLKIESVMNNLCVEALPSPRSRRRRYFSDVLNTLDAVVIGVTVVVAVIYALYDKHFLRDIPRYETFGLPLKAPLPLFWVVVSVLLLLNFPGFI